MPSTKKVFLVSVPAPTIEQTPEEKEYWKWHYALKTKLSFSGFKKKDFLYLANSENQNVGLLSLASYLQSKGIEVKYLAPHLGFEGKNRDVKFFDCLLNEIRNSEYDFVGFSAHTCGIPLAMQYASQLKSAGAKAKTIIGGPHANGTRGETLKELMKSFDFVVRGKGEAPILSLTDGKPNVEGVSYFRADGAAVINPPSMASPSVYPSPANELLNVKNLPAARVYTSLGCRRGKKCVFCADIHNGELVTRAVDDSLNEIKELYQNFGTRYLYFGDENFFFDEVRALKLMQKLEGLDLDLSVAYQARLGSANEKLIKTAARSANHVEVQYGVESASQKVLNLNRKGLRIEMVKKVCEKTVSQGIPTLCYFLVGLPGETEKTAELTISKMEELLSQRIADFVEFRCVVPFPGAAMWENRDEYGVHIKHHKWSEYRGENRPPFDLDGLPSEKIYEKYLEGLRRITPICKERYKEEFGETLIDVNALSAVIEAGF